MIDPNLPEIDQARPASPEPPDLNRPAKIIEPPDAGKPQARCGADADARALPWRRPRRRSP